VRDLGFHGIRSLEWGHGQAVFGNIGSCNTTRIKMKVIHRRPFRYLSFSACRDSPARAGSALKGDSLGLLRPSLRRDGQRTRSWPLTNVARPHDLDFQD
jgi:hypothetical protein